MLNLILTINNDFSCQKFTTQEMAEIFLKNNANVSRFASEHATAAALDHIEMDQHANLIQPLALMQFRLPLYYGDEAKEIGSQLRKDALLWFSDKKKEGTGK